MVLNPSDVETVVGFQREARPLARLQRADVLGGHSANVFTSLHVDTPPSQGQGDVAFAIEGVFISRGGGLFVTGWVNDAHDPVVEIKMTSPSWSLSLPGECLGRTRRPDVEASVAGLPPRAYGFYGVAFSGQVVTPSRQCACLVLLKSGRRLDTEASVRSLEDAELRDLALTFVLASPHLGNPQVKAIEGLDRGAAVEIIKLNRSIISGLTAHPYVERFGRKLAAYKGSIIVCIYGKIEFLFLQAALYARMDGISDYEFIYVSNSPELAEPMLREARAASMIYGLDLTVVLVSGNAGFAAANNAAARCARSDRLLFVNPDVLPIGQDFGVRHTRLVADLPPERTRLFGAALYYDDSSLMHGGMYFELDRGVSEEGGRHRTFELARVEHYGKGTPPEMTTYTRPRRVPAVTGAFMSLDRSWFERLEGFTEDYIFGHYEDADLCLKSLEAGTASWIQDLKLWHLEGKGGVRLPVHEGGVLINRWLFSATWGEALSSGLTGPDPTTALLAEGPDAGGTLEIAAWAAVR